MDVYSLGQEKLSDEYDLAPYLGEEKYDWVVYRYNNYGYDGDGELVALGKDGLLYCMSLGHCSCYGPVDNQSFSTLTVEEFAKGPENIFDNDYALVRSKVLELLGR